MNNQYIEETFGLQGKVAMVTGGNTGIGHDMAVALAKAGADLFIYSYNEANFEEMKKEVEALGRKVVFHVGDLSKPENSKAAPSLCVEKMGKIDILLNNAGLLRRSPILEGKDEDWDAVMNINLNAVYYLSREAGKFMKEQGHGKIINMCSMLTFQGGKFVPSYAASKHGVAGLTKAFANELGEFNVQVNAIAPGYFATAMTQAIRDDEARNKTILQRIPAGRWGKPADLVATAVMLSSNASNYMNASIIPVDGGWLAR